MGIHANRPWRRVALIEDCVGSRGGAFWVLTLECGHVVTRTRLNYMRRPLRALSMPFEYGFAPKRVRCRVCPAVKKVIHA